MPFCFEPASIHGHATSLLALIVNSEEQRRTCVIFLVARSELSIVKYANNDAVLIILESL